VTGIGSARGNRKEDRGVIPKYEIVLYWSDEDGAFLAEVRELPGCMAHGRTREKALASIQEAIRGWIEVAREFGERVPHPRVRRGARR
jgi:predicted RNase H-like HicB family nuclease